MLYCDSHSFSTKTALWLILSANGNTAYFSFLHLFRLGKTLELPSLDMAIKSLFVNYFFFSKWSSLHSHKWLANIGWLSAKGLNSWKKILKMWKKNERWRKISAKQKSFLRTTWTCHFFFLFKFRKDAFLYSLTIREGLNNCTPKGCTPMAAMLKHPLYEFDISESVLIETLPINS